MFAKAIALDPLYARAYAGMADCDSYLSSLHGGAIPADEILATAGRALAMDPNLAEAHAARGFALRTGGRRAEAAAAFERALALDPNCYDAVYLHAELCFQEGDFEQAAKLYLRALEIQPNDYRSPLLVQNAFKTLGRDTEAETYARIGLKRAEEAVQAQRDGSAPLQLGAAALASLGEADRAREWLARALAIDPNDNLARYNAACTYALLGEADRAIDLLEIWVRQVSASAKQWFKNDSDLDSIRNHPRYPKLLELVDSDR